MTFIGAQHTAREAGGFRFGHWFATRGVKPHEHEEGHFMFIVSGEYATRVPGHSNLIYNPPGTRHADHFESNGSFFAIAVPPEFASELPRDPTRIEDARQATVRRLMRADGDLAYALCLELIEGPVEATRPPWLARAEELLRTRNASIDEIASATGVHKVHLTRTFRRFNRCTPAEFARSLRLEHASQLLARTNRSLADIALDCGFADQPHFTKAFQRHCGISPGAYRHATRG